MNQEVIIVLKDGYFCAYGKDNINMSEGKSMHDGTLSSPWDESVINQEESKIVDILTYAQVYITV